MSSLLTSLTNQRVGSLILCTLSWYNKFLINLSYFMSKNYVPYSEPNSFYGVVLETPYLLID